MFDKLSDYCLNKRMIVILTAIILLVTGIYVSRILPIDVLPDLTAPTVAILVDARGMAPEEIESLVAFPIETAMNGATGVRRVRSSLSMGMASIWVDFDWGTEIYLARQIVAEKLQSVSGQLPPNMEPPFLAPVTSLMGEIMLVGVSSDSLSPLELGSFADNILRRRLLSVSGVASVNPIGGERKQYQVLARPDQMAAHKISLNELVEAISKSNENSSGGFFVDMGQDYVIRGVGRVRDLDNLRRAVVALRDGAPVTVDQVADVQIGSATVLGTASVNLTPAVLLSIQKQPRANTLELSKLIDETVAAMQASLPGHIRIDTHVFRQADFIEIAVSNVVGALRDGAVLVVIILFLFLGNIRTTLISLVALPLSVVLTLMALHGFDMSINTMTLGGLAIAIGVMVDDAIIYVENIFRRLRENRLQPEEGRRSKTAVISAAAREIRKPVVIATLIIMAVFIPFFFLSGIEGKLLRPLGVAFVVAVFASLLVAVTVIPALSSYLFSEKLTDKEKDSWLVRKLKKLYQPSLSFLIERPLPVIMGSLALVICALIAYSTLGQSFLPEFNEGSATVITVTPPGTSLEESDDIGRLVEKRLLQHPAVISVARRTGRGELDEHTFGSNQSEMEIRLRHKDFPKEVVFKEFRELLTGVPGTFVMVGQPLTHRIDHMLSGTQAAIAVKIFGDNIYELRRIADRVRAQMEPVAGIVDLAVEQQTDIPQLRIEPEREAMALYGVTVSDLMHYVETAFAGSVVGQVLEGQWPFELVVRLTDESRSSESDIESSLYMTPVGIQVPLRELAHVYRTTGPNKISRENVLRKIVVQANVGDRDLGSVIADVRSKIASNVPLSSGYFIEYGGQFESAQSASRTVLLLSLLSIAAILALLFSEFGSLRDALLIMVNLPLALIGGVFAIFFTSGVVTIAALVGFVTLFGIAARNGILLISHYHHLIDDEKIPLREAVMRGSLERMSPILMTALCAGLALIPLAMGGGQPGKEIETPMAIVILGGLLTSTVLNMIVVPALYYRYNKSKQVCNATE